MTTRHPYISSRRRLSNPWRAGAIALLLPIAFSAIGQAELEPPPPASVSELAPLPQPDLSPLEGSVASQLRRFQALAEQILADSEASTQDQAEVLGELGQHYHAYELVDAAAICYENASRLYPLDFRWQYLWAYLNQKAGNLEAAQLGYLRSLRIRPDSTAAGVHLGEVYLAQNFPDRSRAHLEALLRKSPSTPSAWAVLGQIALSMREYAVAVQIFEQTLAAVPEANRLHYPLALAYRGLGETEKAKEHLAQRGSVGVRPPDPLVDELKSLATGERVHLLRGRLAFRSGRYQEAADAFARAVASKPDSARARVNLGSALAMAGEQDAAIVQYREVLELEPGNATVQFNLGQMLKASDPQAAYDHLSAAVRLEPKDSGARYELGRLLLQSGHGAEALPHLAEAASLTPFGEEIRLAHASLLVDLGRYAEAKDDLSQALELIPQSGMLAHALARLLAAVPDRNLRDGQRALELAQLVVQAQPTSQHVTTLAQAYAELGQCSEAAKWQQKLLEALPEDADAGYRDAVSATLTAYEQGPPCRP